MKVLDSSGDIKLAIVCCLHGDELIGERAYKTHWGFVAERYTTEII